ncbi:hypothetical protein ACFVHB_20030 [Kitasatospora sp. NPDC127111]|uniref:hypothetical protein n=1 Tax=Kitasatospora sp. NPDC127111 TaxID=3345363 RepID=UPI00364227D9
MADPVDVEAVLTRWLRARFDVRSCTELPANLEDVLPVVQVATVGGLAARFSARPRVDVDVYAADYVAARTLALRIRDALITWRGPAEPGAVVSETSIDAEPKRRPYENPALRRIGLTVTIALHPAAY